MGLDNCYDRGNVCGPMYTATKDTPTTAWARHLDAIRRERRWSVTRLFEELYAELGYSAKSRTGIRPLLAGKEPDDRQAAVLRAHFGDPPAEPVPPVAVKPPLDPMERIAAAVEDIARTLASLQTDMAGQSGATIGAVQTLGAQLTAILDRTPAA